MKHFEGPISLLWKMLATIGLVLSLARISSAQTSPGYQTYNFQYLNAVLTSDNPTSQSIAKAFNAEFPPKWYTLSVTTTANGFNVLLEGSLDNVNWTSIAQTNSAIGLVSNSEAHPLLYFRLRAPTITANTSVTATAIGMP